METFLATFLLFLIAMGAMAVGLWVGGKRLSGSCGGRDADGNPLADCLCEKKRAGECEHDSLAAASQLVQLEVPGRGRSSDAAS